MFPFVSIKYRSLSASREDAKKNGARAKRLFCPLWNRPLPKAIQEMARLRQSRKKRWKKGAMFSLELQVLCTTINAVAYKELIRDWLATHSLSMNNGTLLRKGGKSTHAVLFHEAIFYQPRKKHTTLHVCWKISYAFFFWGTWEIKIDSLLFLCFYRKAFHTAF